MASKKQSAHAYITLSARLLLGGLLFYAGFSKLSNIPKFAEDVEHYKLPQLLPDSLVTPALYTMRAVAVTLPWNEVLIGAMLILGIWTRTAALLSLFLFSIFAMAVSSAIVRKLNISCGCFNSEGAARVGLQTLSIDAVGLVLALIVVVKSRALKMRKADWT